MQPTIPYEVEDLIQKRLASGAFANAEDVVRRALEVLDDEESLDGSRASSSRP